MKGVLQSFVRRCLSLSIWQYVQLVIFISYFSAQYTLHVQLSTRLNDALARLDKIEGWMKDKGNELVQMKPYDMKATYVHSRGKRHSDESRMNKLWERIESLENRIAASSNFTLSDRGAFCVQGQAGRNGMPGKNGIPGRDGKDGTPGRDETLQPRNRKERDENGWWTIGAWSLICIASEHPVSIEHFLDHHSTKQVRTFMPESKTFREGSCMAHGFLLTFPCSNVGRDGTDGRNGIPGINGTPGRQGLPEMVLQAQKVNKAIRVTEANRVQMGRLVIR